MTVGGSVLLAVLVEELRAVVRPDAIAQVVEQTSQLAQLPDFDDQNLVHWQANY